jgi:hypothetical protein
MTTHAFFDPFGAFAGAGSALDDPGAAPRELSYPALLGTAWWRLPAGTRERFERHDAVYTGTMALHATRAGWWVERLCRLVGSPLPPAHSTPLAATVRVEPDYATGGSRWTRRYEFPTRTVTISSVKAIDADGTLVERLDCGLRMRLAIGVRDGALTFDSAGYYVELPGLRWQGRRYAAWRLSLPSWFLPGRTCVAHHDLGNRLFRFTMTVRHALLGKLFSHDGVFRSTGE